MDAREDMKIGGGGIDAFAPAPAVQAVTQSQLAELIHQASNVHGQAYQIANRLELLIQTITCEPPADESATDKPEPAGIDALRIYLNETHGEHERISGLVEKLELLVKL